MRTIHTQYSFRCLEKAFDAARNASIFCFPIYSCRMAAPKTNRGATPLASDLALCFVLSIHCVVVSFPMGLVPCRCPLVNHLTMKDVLRLYRYRFKESLDDEDMCDVVSTLRLVLSDVDEELAKTLLRYWGFDGDKNTEATPQATSGPGAARMARMAC